ncbi:MAG: hypothetical protein A3H93_09305 [Rhodocyclales bacterium RIFCSPLOWO2_02_FULL_63_24]|nr:MAG: hypothetical protein A3H93_09305 [Rhodocyclales bacterium RIFCSPLOWO2_02_FULL_63_24]
MPEATVSCPLAFEHRCDRIVEVSFGGSIDWCGLFFVRLRLRFGLNLNRLWWRHQCNSPSASAIAAKASKIDKAVSDRPIVFLFPNQRALKRGISGASTQLLNLCQQRSFESTNFFF